MQYICLVGCKIQPVDSPYGECSLSILCLGAVLQYLWYLARNYLNVLRICALICTLKMLALDRLKIIRHGSTNDLACTVELKVFTVVRARLSMEDTAT